MFVETKPEPEVTNALPDCTTFRSTYEFHFCTSTCTLPTTNTTSASNRGCPAGMQPTQDAERTIPFSAAGTGSEDTGRLLSRKPLDGGVDQPAAQAVHGAHTAGIGCQSGAGAEDPGQSG